MARAVTVKNISRPAFRPLTAWSFSRYSLYKQCPAKFYYSTILKLEEPKGAALERGGAIHDQADDFVKGKVKKLPDTLTHFAPEFRRIQVKFKKEPTAIVAESEWAFTRAWGPSQWKDWDNCWLRVKVDLAERVGNIVTITDWKTGRYRPDNREDYLEQLELYGVGALHVYGAIPDLHVKARLVYLDANVIYPEPGAETIVTAKDVPALRKTWEKRVQSLFADKTFAPKPNQFCRFCHFRKENSGPCQF